MKLKITHDNDLSYLFWILFDWNEVWSLKNIWDTWRLPNYDIVCYKYHTPTQRHMAQRGFVTIAKQIIKHILRSGKFDKK